MNDPITNEDAGEVKSPPPASGRTWIFQANPKLFNIDEAITHLSEMTWSVSAHKELISPGDKVFLWKSGPEAGIIGEATVLAPPSLARPSSVQSVGEKSAWMTLCLRSKIPTVSGVQIHARSTSLPA